jgi:hypothetical protein
MACSIDAAPTPGGTVNPMAPNQHPRDETHWQQQQMTLAPSRFLAGLDGEPMLTFQPAEVVTRVFSCAPSMGDAGFIRTGGGAFQHRSPAGERL